MRNKIVIDFSSLAKWPGRRVFWIRSAYLDVTVAATETLFHYRILAARGLLFIIRLGFVPILIVDST